MIGIYVENLNLQMVQNKTIQKSYCVVNINASMAPNRENLGIAIPHGRRKFGKSKDAFVTEVKCLYKTISAEGSQ